MFHFDTRGSKIVQPGAQRKMADRNAYEFGEVGGGFKE